MKTFATWVAVALAALPAEACPPALQFVQPQPFAVQQFVQPVPYDVGALQLVLPQPFAFPAPLPLFQPQAFHGPFTGLRQGIAGNCPGGACAPLQFRQPVVAVPAGPVVKTERVERFGIFGGRRSVVERSVQR